MKGFGLRDEGAASGGNLPTWEALVVDAVGNVIEFWGFKRNQGRVWALLYLRGRPLSAGEIQHELGLSKGAVSMVTRELEQWGVVHRARAPGDPVWRFGAETDLLRMLRRVIRERESTLVARVKADLEEAERLARADPDVSPEVLARLGRMRTLAAVMEKAIRAFLQTARFDVGGAARVLSNGPRSLRRRKRS